METPISTGEAPVYLRLSRVGDLWDMRYSYDGADWQAGGVFTHTLQVTSIGIFGGSQASGVAGTLPQTMVLDYAFRADDPVIPQDGLVMYADDLRIEIDPFADAGTVSGGPVTPTPGNPGCGNPIRLVALPKDGWRFDQWVWQGIESTDRVLEGAFGFGEDIVAQFIRLQERRIYLPSIWADVN